MQKEYIFILFCMFMISVSGCGRSSSETENVEEVYKIADSVYEQYSCGAVVVGEIVRGEEEKGYLYAVMLTEDVVLVATDNLLQSVEGYVVSYNKGEMAIYIKVPENLHYDGDRITLDAVDGYDNIYTFRAGL